MTRRLDAGPLLVTLGAVLLLVSLFLYWFEGDVTAWQAFEVWDVVLLVLAIGGIVLGVGLAVPDAEVIDRGWLPFGVGAVAVIVASQIVDPPPAVAGRNADVGAWLALGSALIMCAGAVLTFGRVHLALMVEGRDPRQHFSAVDARGEPDATTDSHAAVAAEPAEAAATARGRAGGRPCRQARGRARRPSPPRSGRRSARPTGGRGARRAGGRRRAAQAAVRARDPALRRRARDARAGADRARERGPRCGGGADGRESAAEEEAELMPAIREVAFHLDRFEWAEDRLEVAGRWQGLAGRRLSRPVLTITIGERRKRIAALPGDHAHAEEWLAEFPYPADPDDITLAELEVGRSVVVELPLPDKRRRRRRRSASQDTGEVLRAEAGALRSQVQRLRAELAGREREIMHLKGELDALSTDERDALLAASTQEHAAIPALDDATVEIARVAAERDAALGEAERVAAELDAARQDADRAVAERDELSRPGGRVEAIAGRARRRARGGGDRARAA